MEIMIQLNVYHKSTENMERVEHNFGSFHGVTESVERVEKLNIEYTLWKFHDFTEKSQTLAGM